jgi:hypothetical protein
MLSMPPHSNDTDVNALLREAYAPELIPPTCFYSYDEAIEWGLLLSKTKGMPPSRFIADWQSVDTVYAVVQRDAFMAWRQAVLNYLENRHGLASDPWWEFLDTCRVAWFMELLEGIKLLREFKQVGL